MLDGAEWSTETVSFTAADGTALVGDLAVPAGVTTVPSNSSPTDCGSIAAVVCHPHPQYGGDRQNPVVDSCWRALAAAGIVALRFDFRAAFGGGVDERSDVTAALDLLASRAERPRLVAVGYSFGAMVVLGADLDRCDAQVLIAPPLTSMDDLGAPRVPTHVLIPVGDQFTSPDAAAPIMDRWRAAGATVTAESVTMADHFLAGRADHVAERTVSWLTASVGD
ncbi:MAG: alpha/beta fold hydrolase [Actinomycetota bacterium]